MLVVTAVLSFRPFHEPVLGAPWTQAVPASRTSSALPPRRGSASFAVMLLALLARSRHAPYLGTHSRRPGPEVEASARAFLDAILVLRQQVGAGGHRRFHLGPGLRHVERDGDGAELLGRHVLLAEHFEVRRAERDHHAGGLVGGGEDGAEVILFMVLVLGLERPGLRLEVAVEQQRSIADREVG